MHILTRLGEVTCSSPLRDQLKHCAVRLRPAVDIGCPCWLEQCPFGMSGQCPKCLRRVGRTKAGEPDIGDRLVQRRRGDLQTVEVRCFALIGCHAVGGVPFYMLDGAKALTHRKLDVFCRHIILEIDECLYTALVLRRRQHVDNRARAKIPIARTSANTYDIFIWQIGDICAQVIAPFQAALAVRP